MLPSANGPQHLKVLLLDASPPRALQTLEQLQRAERTPFETKCFETLDDAIRSLGEVAYDVFIVGISHDPAEAVNAIRAFRAYCPSIPIFVVAESEVHSQALEILREGAEDCLVRKFINPRAIERAILYGIERKLGQSALQESDLRYRALFSQIRLGIALFDVTVDEDGQALTHRFVEVNTAFEGYEGRQSDQVLGRTIDEVFPDDRSFWRRACEEAGAIKGLAHFETYELSSERWLEVLAFRLGNGQIAVTFADISERKRAQEVLRESEEQFRELAENIREVLFVSTPEPVRVTYIGPAYDEIWGRPRQEVYERPAAWVESIHPEDRARAASVFAQSQQGVPTDMEYRIVRPDGSLRWIRNRTFPVFDAGRFCRVVGIAEDITERKGADETLKESERRHRLLFERNIAGVLHTTLDGTVLSCNQAAAELFGHGSPAKFLGSCTADYYLPSSDRAKIIEELKLKKIVTDHEIEIRRRDGGNAWLIANLVLVEDDPNTGEIIEGSLIDITERKRNEEDLLFKTALLEAQSETTIDGILVVDESDRVVLANKRFAQVFAIPDEVMSLREDRLLLQYVTGLVANADAFLERVKYLNGHRQERSRDELGLKDGRILDRYSAPLTDANGTYRGRIWYFRDITERKRGEEELYRSRQMLRSVLDNIPQRVFWKDRNSLFLGCNQAFASDAGLSSPAEIVGKSDFELPWSEMATGHRADDKYVMEQGIAKLHFDESRTKTDGSFSWVRANKLPLRDREGNVTGVIATYEDITERKRLEVDLQQAQKLEAVGHLAAGIAHEINTPIQFVGDNTRFMRDAFGEVQKLLQAYEQAGEAAAGKVDGQLLRDLADAREQSDWEYLKSEIPKALDQTLDGVDRVARIVRAMKEFSHVDRSGKKAAADLNRALESTLVVARNELKYVADVVTEFGEIPTVVCNLGDLNQVFLNLLVNAAHGIEDVVRGTGAKGTIRLKTWQEGEQVVVSISDTGTGIPEEIRQKIFEPFFTTKEVGRGSGQGLALARGVVVDRHSGSLTFETEIGKGTTFFVRLPLNSAEISKQEDQRLAASAVRG